MYNICNRPVSNEKELIIEGPWHGKPNTKKFQWWILPIYRRSNANFPQTLPKHREVKDLQNSL